MFHTFSLPRPLRHNGHDIEDNIVNRGRGEEVGGNEDIDDVPETATSLLVEGEEKVGCREAVQVRREGGYDLKSRGHRAVPSEEAEKELRIHFAERE